MEDGSRVDDKFIDEGMKEWIFDNLSYVGRIIIYSRKHSFLISKTLFSILGESLGDDINYVRIYLNRLWDISIIKFIRKF